MTGFSGIFLRLYFIFERHFITSFTKQINFIKKIFLMLHFYTIINSTIWLSIASFNSGFNAFDAKWSLFILFHPVLIPQFFSLVMLHCSITGTTESVRQKRPTCPSSARWKKEWWASWSVLESIRELLIHQERTVNRRNTPHTLHGNTQECIHKQTGLKINIIPIQLTHTILYIVCFATSVK